MYILICKFGRIFSCRLKIYKKYVYFAERERERFFNFKKFYIVWNFLILFIVTLTCFFFLLLNLIIIILIKEIYSWRAALVFEETFDYHFSYHRLSANSQEYERLRDIVKPHTARTVHPLYSWSGNRWKRRHAWRRYRRKSFYINTDSLLAVPRIPPSRSITPFPIQCSRGEIDRGRRGGIEGGEVERLGRVEPPCSSIFMSAECAGSEPIYRLCSARMHASAYACVYTCARVCTCVYTGM